MILVKLKRFSIYEAPTNDVVQLCSFGDLSEPLKYFFGVPSNLLNSLSDLPEPPSDLPEPPIDLLQAPS